jgi:hypothetical protein
MSGYAPMSARAIEELFGLTEEDARQEVQDRVKQQLALEWARQVDNGELGQDEHEPDWAAMAAAALRVIETDEDDAMVAYMTIIGWW